MVYEKNLISQPDHNQIMEPWNHLGWKKPLQHHQAQPSAWLPTSPLTHVPKHHMHTSLKYLQERGLHHFPGESIPTPWRNSDIQSTPSLLQLGVISSHPKFTLYQLFSQKAHSSYYFLKNCVHFEKTPSLIVKLAKIFFSSDEICFRRLSNFCMFEIKKK